MTTLAAAPAAPEAPPASARGLGSGRPQPGRRRPGRRETSRRRSQPAGVRAAWTTRAAQLGLWGLVALGAAAGVAALALQLLAPAEAPAQAAAPVSSTAAEGFAELYVAAFLAAGEGAEDALAPFYAEPVSLAGVEAAAVWVQRAAAVDVAPMGERGWAVMVAAEVLLADEQGQWRPDGRRYYQIGVVETAGGLAATSLPARVAAPAAPQQVPGRAVGAFSGAGVDGEPVQTAERFLAAYLAGEGEVARYTAPGLALAPLDPPGYRGVAVRRAGSHALADGGVLVGVEAAAADEAGRVEVLHYWLDVVERAGRWEVAALHAAAPLAPSTP